MNAGDLASPTLLNSTARTTVERTVETTAGAIRGVRNEQGIVFLDVPYAAAPVAERRFAAPQPHEHWSGVRDATRLGPNAPQPPRGRFGRLDLSPFFGDGWQRGDDYLTVNLWTPATSEAAPVIVFVHGGAFVAGSTHGSAYDGSAFARDGVVFVSVNYRLGIPGFLHLADAPDNRGQLDVIAVLHWVHDNIARFGGDPGNVTLAGQSAGGIIVSSILSAPDASGMFAHAIVQSGSAVAAFTTEQASIVTDAVGRELGVVASAAALSGISDERFLELMPALSALDLATASAYDPLGGITPFSLVLENQPADAVAAGSAAAVAVLIGSTLDEAGLYLAPVLNLDDTTDADLHDTAARFHDRPDELVRAYRAARPTATSAELRVAILGDGMFGLGVHRLAEAHARTSGRTFVYEFMWRPDALGGQLGSCHLMELPFVFDRTELTAFSGQEAILGTTRPPAGLATRTHAAWVQFARTGAPGWAQYRPENPVVERIDAVWSEAVEPHRAEYAAWNLPA